MSGFSGIRRLVWVPVFVGLAATTVTGCKKTIHATKPLANISQAVVASASPSASTAPTTAAASSASSAAPSVVASLSATSVPVATPAKTGGSGCTLIPPSAVAAILGVASVTTKTAITKITPPLISHQGCQYLAAGAGAGFDINTFSTGVPPQGLIQAQIAKLPGAKQTTVDGLPAYSVPIPGAVAEEEVGFYKGQQSVAVLTHGKAGASLALAELIARQI